MDETVVSPPATVFLDFSFLIRIDVNEVCERLGVTAQAFLDKNAADPKHYQPMIIFMFNREFKKLMVKMERGEL